MESPEFVLQVLVSSDEDEEILPPSPKRIRLMKPSKSNVGLPIPSGEKVHLEKSDQTREVDAGVSSLLKRKRTFQYEDEGILHRKPKDIRLMKPSESNVGLPIPSGERFHLNKSDQSRKVDAGVSPLLKGERIEVEKEQKTRPPSNHGRIVDLARPKPNVTPTNVTTPTAGTIEDLRSFINQKRRHPVKGIHAEISQPADAMKESKPIVKNPTVGDVKEFRSYADSLKGYKPVVPVTLNATREPNERRKLTAGENEDFRSFLNSRNKKETQVITPAIRSCVVKTSSSSARLSEKMPTPHQRFQQPKKIHLFTEPPKNRFKYVKPQDNLKRNVAPVK